MPRLSPLGSALDVRANTHVVGAVGEGAPVLVAGDVPMVTTALGAAGDRRPGRNRHSGSESAAAARYSPRTTLRQSVRALLTRHRAESIMPPERAMMLATLIQPRASCFGDQAVLEAAKAQAAVLLLDA
jgi:hypothetical protein